MATQEGGIRVLLVDDHRMVRETIRRLLTNAQNIDVVGMGCLQQGAQFCPHVAVAKRLINVGDVVGA